MSLINKISNALQLPKSYLWRMARTASHCYKTYTIPKRAGGTRTIHHPSKELKALQRWLLEYVVTPWPVSPCAKAYIKGRSIADNAQVHLPGGFLLRLDLQDFFPSITSEDIHSYLDTHPPGIENWTSSDREFFIAIVCRDSRLTIGSPTAPALSNAICSVLDSRLQQITITRGVAYSRYADDLFFSSSNFNQIQGLDGEVDQVLREIPFPTNLALNRQKTHYSSKRSRRVVTGIILTSDNRLSIGRRRKRQIRALIHQYNQLSRTQKRYLAGLLAFACDIEPDLVNALILKYGHSLVARARTF